MIRKTYSKIQQFDEVTKFRLFNSFIFAIGFNLFVPILVDLKGELLVAWVISSFMIAEQLIVKTNRFFVNKFSISQLYKLGIIVHIIFILTSLVYFINPYYMVLMEATLSIIVIAVFGAYSIKLNNYITANYPDSMSEFQIIRNSTWADGLLLGLLITTIITYFFPISVGLICFVVYNIFFTMWMIYNWSFFDKLRL